MDEIPVSLAIAQAAKETGWGTSRFANHHLHLSNNLYYLYSLDRQKILHIPQVDYFLSLETNLIFEGAGSIAPLMMLVIGDGLVSNFQLKAIKYYFLTHYLIVKFLHRQSLLNCSVK